MAKCFGSKIKNSAFVAFIVVFINQPLNAQVAMDGYFNDWTNVDVMFTDTIGDGYEFDFTELKITNDENRLYLNILFSNDEFNLQRDNGIKVYIDCDINPNTGLNISNIGADIEWSFGKRQGFYFNRSTPEKIDLVDFRVKISPTYTSQRFEVSVPRTLNSTLFIRDSIKIVMSEAKDYFPDQNNSIAYYVDPEKSSDYSAKSIARFDSSHIRVLSYNVYFSGPVKDDRKEYFERIVKAVKPDIIAFQEMVYLYENKLASTIRSWLNNTDYNVIAQDGVNMVVSRFPILEESVFISSGRISAVLLDTENELGKNLLLFNTHLAYESDSSRQADADETIMNLARLKSGTGPFQIESNIPIIICGDFNLSGSAHVLRTFITGDIYDEGNFGADTYPDWDNSEMKDLNSLQLTEPVNYTTARHGDGKIDYVFYTDSNLEIGNHYILNTTTMSDTGLQRYNLNRMDTEQASDHLPTIFDLIPQYLVGINNKKTVPGNFELNQNYPNSFNSDCKIRYSLPETGNVQLTVYTILGEKIIDLVKQSQNAGQYEIIFNSSNLASGIYLYRLKTDNFTDIKKMLSFK